MDSSLTGSQESLYAGDEYSMDMDYMSDKVIFQRLERNYVNMIGSHFY